MFTTTNTLQMRKSTALDLIHVKITQITAHDWNVVQGHKWFIAA